MVCYGIFWSGQLKLPQFSRRFQFGIMRFLTPFFYRTRMFVRWMNGTCIETPPQHAEGEDEPVVFSFFTDISANPAIIDLVTALSKSVQNTLGMLNKYLTRWRRYRLLWKLDKVGVHQSPQRFKPTEGVTIIVSGCVDTAYLFVASLKDIHYSMNRNGPPSPVPGGSTSCLRTSNIVPVRLAKRVWGT